MPPAELAPGERPACELRMPSPSHLQWLAANLSTARYARTRPHPRSLGRPLCTPVPSLDRPACTPQA
eukprot:672557-Prymnesium_polylepis.1